MNVNEAVTTLLLNYVALYLMLYLIYDPWKDLNGDKVVQANELQVFNATGGLNLLNSPAGYDPANPGSPVTTAIQRASREGWLQRFFNMINPF